MATRARTRLAGALAADMRALPFASNQIGGVVAFYSLIHVPRSEIGAVLEEFRRVLRPGGRALFSAHEGQGQFERDELLDERVPLVGTFFELDELVAAATTAGLAVTTAERRPPYSTEGDTVRLYVEAERRPRH